MKSKFYFLLIFVLAITNKAETKITFAVGGAPTEVQFWEKLIAEFKRRTAITVELIRQPTDTDQRRQMLLIPLKAKKHDPDVFLLDIAWLGQFASSKWLQPLDKYIRDFNFNSNIIFKSILDSVDRYQGKIIALPVYLDAGLLYYRKDLLAKYGFENPPTTWKELLLQCLKVQKEERKHNPNFYGFLWQGAQYEGLICNFLEFALSAGGGIEKNKNKIKIATLKNIKALQFMVDLIQKYKISPPNTYTEMKEEEVRLFFENGNALFERNWPYAWALHQSENSAVKDKFAVTSLPHFPEGKSTAILGGWHIAISRFSDDKLSAFKFIKFVLSRNIQKKLALHLGWNPARWDLYQDEELLSMLPHLKILLNVLKNASPRPNIPYYSLLSQILQRYINSALAGKLKPHEALLKAQEEISNLIKRYE